ncbi:684_t:CDS:1, partial [Scutellospora calospora]
CLSKAFVHNGKIYKIYADYLVKRTNKRAVKNITLGDNTQNNIESISLKDLSEYVIKSIKNLEPGTGFFLITQVEITNISISDDQSFKIIANIIVYNIEK